MQALPTFTDLVRSHVARRLYSAGQLAKLTGLSRETIANWLEGRVRRPRNWRDLLLVAAALHMTRAETDELLTTAGHPRLEALADEAATPRERALFAPWRAEAISIEQALQRLRQLPLDTVPPVAPLPRGSRMPLSHNPLFRGREAELHAAARIFAANRGHVKTLVLAGMPGIGKTQLAVELAHRYGRFFAGGVFWLSFAVRSAVPDEIAACGGPDGLDLRPDYGTLDQRAQLALVEAAWRSPLPRLLIFDNCEDEAVLARWRPTSGGAVVLATSRRGVWDPALGVTVLPLTGLPRPSSMALLRMGRNADELDAAVLDAIAAELDDHPLALHLAAAYLFRYRHSITPATYLGELRAASVEHRSLVGSGVSPTRHAGDVARILALSVAQLDPARPTDRAARALLARAALLALGEPIPRALLQATLDPELRPDRQLFDDALLRLEELGLVTIDARGAARLHRLVAAYARQRLADPAAQAAVEQAVVALAQQLNDAGDIPALRQLHRHLRHLADADADHPNRIALQHMVGLTLWRFGEYAEADRYLAAALAALRSQSEPDATAIAALLNLLALLHQLQSRFDPALPLFLEAHALWQRNLASDDPMWATSHNNLGYLYLLLGDYDRADHHLRSGLQLRRQRFGIRHHETARSIHNLGYLRLRQGRYRSARRYLLFALRLRRAVLPTPHAATATTLGFLGEVLLLQGRYPAARERLEESLTMRMAIFGERHHDTAESLYMQGRLHASLGDFDEGEERLEQALAIFGATVGDAHRDTAFALHSMGCLMRDTGRHDAALGYLERALDSWKQQVALPYPEAAATLRERGLLQLARGDTAAARDDVEHALAMQQTLLPPEHPETGASYVALARVLTATGDIAQAKAALQQAAAIFERSLGVEHPAMHELARLQR